MAERLIGLSLKTLFNGDHNHPDLPRFIEGFSKAIHGGDGKKAQAIDWLGIDTHFPLRLLVGMPKKDMTREQRLFAEAWCSIFFGKPIGDRDGLWTLKPVWTPTNPNRTPDNTGPLNESILDVDWMLSLGVSRGTWENIVLHSTAAISSVQRGENTAGRSLRHYMMLSVFGFQDPGQFFIKQSTPRNPD